MDAFKMVRLLRARQNEILEAMPPAQLAEYRELDAMVRAIDRLILEAGAGAQVEMTPRLEKMLTAKDVEAAKPSRVPLTVRREQLWQYLREKGPSSRAQLLLHTGIPPGTLSTLLNEDATENKDGLWRLKEKTR